MLSPHQELQQAQKLQKQGRWPDARALLETAAQRPTTPDFVQKVLDLLLQGSLKAKDYALAAQYADQMIARFPKEARSYNNRGIVAACQARPAEGAEYFRKAVELNATYRDAQLNLAKAYFEAKQWEWSRKVLEQCVAQAPYDPALYQFLAQVCRALKRPDLAALAQQKRQWLLDRPAPPSPSPWPMVVSFQAPTVSAPAELTAFRDQLLQYSSERYKQRDWPQAQKGYEAVLRLHQLAPLADAWKVQLRLGDALANQKKPAEAATVYEEVLRAQPNQPSLQYNYARILMDAGQGERAEKFVQPILAATPGRHDLREILGKIYLESGRLPEAEDIFRSLHKLFPKVSTFSLLLGNVFTLVPDHRQALAAFTEAQERGPGKPHIRMNRSLSLLSQGDFEQGWPEYEARKFSSAQKRKPNWVRPFSQPEWTGQNLEGKTVLVCSEQGLGDNLHFVRLCAELKQRGARVLFYSCHPGHDRLLPLLRSYSGIDELLPNGLLPDHFDYHVDLLSLPLWLGIGMHNIPAPHHYLEPEPQRLEKYGEILGKWEGFKIGIAWQGNPRHMRDRFRSFPLKSLRGIANLPGVRLFNLQKLERKVPVPFSLVELERDLDRDGAFLDTAAVVRHLDLVICCDSSIAHLAGAVGAPRVWLALSTASDWHWLQDRTDTPWYPNVKLFRQAQLGDWEGVFDQMRAELQQFLAVRQAPSAAVVEVSIGELLDKITILRIKRARIQDPQKVQNVVKELALLESAHERFPTSAEVQELLGQLLQVNEQLWEIEDAIRLHEKRGDFGAEFIALARSVYQTNDRRSELKKKINQLTQSGLVEEKSYA